MSFWSFIKSIFVQKKAVRPVAPFAGLVGLTGSMKPTLQGLESYICRPIPFDQIVVNDIIVYWDEARQIAPIHRVVATKPSAHGRGLILKGDNNPEPDKVIVTEAEYIGKPQFDKPIV